MNLTKRGQIQTQISNSILTNPDAMLNFISFVCNEVSMVELERIYSKFKKQPIEITSNQDN